MWSGALTTVIYFLDEINDGRSDILGMIISAAANGMRMMKIPRRRKKNDWIKWMLDGNKIGEYETEDAKQKGG